MQAVTSQTKANCRELFPMDLKKRKEFYLYNCIHRLRTLAYRSKWMILECYYTKHFHDSYYLQRRTHLCLKNKPSRFKGAGTRKYKKCIICCIRGIPQQSVLLIIEHCKSVTINTFLFWKLAANLLCTNKKRTAYIWLWFLTWYEA